MSTLLDYMHPDIAFGRDVVVVEQLNDGTDTLIIMEQKGKFVAIRVHAHRGNKSAIMCCRYWTWDCSHLRQEHVCGYAPGHEDLPPIPGQHCHNCGQLRAESISQAFRVRVIKPV
mgnify:FL=1